jgi:hypothetical protein
MTSTRNRGYNIVANALEITTSNAFEASDRLALVDGSIAEAATVAKIAEVAKNKFKSIDSLVNNAGIYFAKNTSRITTWAKSRARTAPDAVPNSGRCGWDALEAKLACRDIGCCDSSPSQHASKHAATTGHPIIASFEPGEAWFYDYETRGMDQGVELLPRHSHPEDQPSPGPAGRVPANWESLLH